MTISQNDAKDFYRTADLALCGVLCVCGFIIEEVEKVNPQRSVFIFKNSSALEKIIEEYWQGKLRVEPQAYFSQIRTLKARIYQR